MSQTYRLQRKGDSPAQMRLFENIHRLQIQLAAIAEKKSLFSGIFSHPINHSARELVDELDNITDVLSWYQLTQMVDSQSYDIKIKTLFKRAFVDHELGENHIKEKATRISNLTIDAVSKHQGPPIGAFGVLAVILQNQRTFPELYEQAYLNIANSYDKLVSQNKQHSNPLDVMPPIIR